MTSPADVLDTPHLDDEDVIDVEEIFNLDRTSERDDYCVVQLCRVDDVPTYDDGYFYSGTRQDIYVKMYISKDLTIPGMMSVSDFGKTSSAHDDYSEYLKITNTTRQIGRLSDIHYSLRKYDEGKAIWNSYHNFKIKPPPGALLTVELYHSSRKQSVTAAERAMGHGEAPDAAHGMIGSLHIPLANMIEGKTSKYLFDQKFPKYPNFGVHLRRVYVTKNPPRIKTFFLIRHGESKWNLAQEKGSISGMLHRDHSLTTTGANQAKGFNASWRKYEENKDKSIEEIHEAEVAGYVKEVVTTEDRKHKRHHHQLTAEEIAMLSGETSIKSSAPGSTISHIQAAGEGSSKGGSEKKTMFSRVFGASSKSSSVKSTVSEISNISETAATDQRSRSSSIDMDTDIYPDGTTKCDERAPSPVSIPTSTALSGTKKKTVKLRSRSRGDSAENFDEEATDSENEDELNVEDIIFTTVDRQFLLKTDTEKKLMMPALQVKRRVNYIKQFLEADEVYVSPLTRAIQTALFTLEMHPALYGSGLHVGPGLHIMSTLREFKGVGGLDTVGRETGSGIKKRVVEELADIVGGHEAERVSAIEFDVLDAELHWWTDINHFEGKKEMNDRMCEFLDFAQFCEAKMPIFVGHSNFFRFFYSNYLSDIIQHNRPRLCADLRRNRLSNACGLAVTVLFEEEEDDEPVTLAELRAGVRHGSASTVHTHIKAKHKAKIIDADIIFSDHRLSFANGNKAIPDEN
jgi:broad specificity phosphatase PhoE